MATYTPSNIPTTLYNGDIINCSYSGSVQSITLPVGIYKLECWGASGGYSYSSTYGGGAEVIL